MLPAVGHSALTAQVRYRVLKWYVCLHYKPGSPSSLAKCREADITSKSNHNNDNTKKSCKCRKLAKEEGLSSGLARAARGGETKTFPRGTVLFNATFSQVLLRVKISTDAC